MLKMIMIQHYHMRVNEARFVETKKYQITLVRKNK